MALKVWTSGEWDGLAELRAQLASAEGLEAAEGWEDAEAIVHAATPGGYRDDLARLREHTHVPVVVLARSAEAGLLEASLDLGMVDVLILPQPTDAVVFAVRRAAAASRWGSDRPKGRVVTVFSPKGGTGKSVVACNLAVALARQGHRTLLVDLDLQFGDVAIMLGLQPQRTLYDLLTTPGPLDTEKIAGYATHHASGLHVLPAPLKPEDGELISEARVGELLDAARSGYGAIVVDTAPFFQGAVLATVDRTTDLLMVCTPDVPTLKNVRLTLQTLELLSFPTDRIRVVLNRANARIGFRASQIASVLEQEVAFELPEDEAVAIGVNRGVAAVDFKAQSSFAQALNAVATSLLSHGSAGRSKPRRRFALGRRA